MARCHKGGFGPSSGAGNGMKVDVVGQFVVGVVFEVKFHFVTDLGADKTARHGTAKGPIHVSDAIGHFAFLLEYLHINDQFFGPSFGGWGRNVGRGRQYGLHFGLCGYIHAAGIGFLLGLVLAGKEQSKKA